MLGKPGVRSWRAQAEAASAASHCSAAGATKPAWVRTACRPVALPVARCLLRALRAPSPMPLSNRPAPPPAGGPPEMQRWRLWGTDGSFNWGLATFVALAVACAAVWGAMLVQWAAYCR